MAGPSRLLLTWLFEDRRTGRIVVVQWPNIPLWVWIAASVLNRLAQPDGRWGTVLSVTGTVALTLWAIDEIVRGVNPWRQILGAGVLTVVAITLLVAVL